MYVFVYMLGCVDFGGLGREYRFGEVFYWCRRGGI
jgi:hypothetical protein